MINKLKGCRPSNDILIDITNTSAHYGAAKYRLETTLPIDLANIKGRLDELHLEMTAARKQENALKEAPKPVDAPAEPSLMEVVQ